MLYACQDFEHDRTAGLNSVPQAFGLEAAFWTARAMHLGMLALLLWLARLFALGPVAVAGVAVVAALLLYEHSHHFAQRPSPHECCLLHAQRHYLRRFLLLLRGGCFSAANWLKKAHREARASRSSRCGKLLHKA